ncbi:hypothetical protein PS834_04064 [Pseudomonas fluorescens]|nr:hypothetical protein PS834_04064 [Pseudomonas fluorescens]
MARQRFAFAWIACLAVLFNAFAMPMAGVMQQGQSPAEQLLWGSFCSSNGSKLVAISLGKLDIPAPQQDEHSSMQHCWCCSGSPPLLALGHVPQLYLTRIDPAPGLPSPTLQAPTPRQQWPSLNPRASPAV